MERGMLRWSLLLTTLVLMPLAAAAERLALFPAELYSSSLEPTRQSELDRLHLIWATVAEELSARGYTVLDTEAVAADVKNYAYLHDCGGCEVGMGRKLGADIVAVTWVQKVSNLILNVNLRLRDVRTGETLRTGSIDIRSNTDESWQQGARYLIEKRMFLND